MHDVQYNSCDTVCSVSRLLNTMAKQAFLYDIDISKFNRNGTSRVRFHNSLKYSQ